MKLISELSQLKEIKNELGETVFTTFAGWKRAVKQFYPDAWFDGDADISNAMIGQKPYKRHETMSVGEWDGAQGAVFKGISLKKSAEKVEEQNVSENEELSVGDEVVVVGDVRFHGLPGYIIAFDSTRSFAVVKLYSQKEQHSFHVSDLEKTEEEEEEEDQDQEFYVTFHNENSGSSWIGMLTKEGGSKWRERSVRGESDYRWGDKSYMGYLSPSDVMNWITQDYRRLHVDGPFASEDEAVDHIESNYGPMQEAEKTKSLMSDLIENSLLEEKTVARSGDFKITASAHEFTLHKKSKRILKMKHEDWNDLADAVKNRIAGSFGDYKLIQRGDSYLIVDSKGEDAVYLSASDMDTLISDTADYLKKINEDHHDSEEDFDEGEYDQEGSMAKTQLITIMQSVDELMTMIEDDDNLPEWVQSKLTIAQDYMVTVRDYLKAKDADI